MKKKVARRGTPIHGMVGRSIPAFPPQPPTAPDTRKHEHGRRQDRQQPPRKKQRTNPPPSEVKEMTPCTVAVALRVGKFFARISTRVGASPRAHLAPRACIGVPKSCVRADLVGCRFMGHITVGTLDGAPMVRRRHHLEKAVAVNVMSLMVNIRRKPGLSPWHPVR